MAASRPFLILLALGAAGLTGPGRVVAQGNVQVSLSTTTVTFASPGVADLDAGWVDHEGVAVGVQSRPQTRPWELRVRATGPTLGSGKPVSQLLWRVPGSTAWTPLSETDSMVLQGTGNGTVQVQLRMALSWAEDAPGSYSAVLEFTLLRI